MVSSRRDRASINSASDRHATRRRRIASESRHAEVDYAYELTEEELRHSASRDDLARLTWLDQARRFTLLARHAETGPTQGDLRASASGMETSP
jgi:hypothetical protein